MVMRDLKITVHTLQRDCKSLRHIWLENIEWEVSSWFQIGCDGSVLYMVNNRSSSIAYYGGCQKIEANNRGWLTVDTVTFKSTDDDAKFDAFFIEQFDLSKVKPEYISDIHYALRGASLSLSDFRYSEWGTW